MSRTALLGVIGGILIAVSVFLVGNTITFTSDHLTETSALVLLASGIIVALFSFTGNRILAGYGAMIAFTLALVSVVDQLRDGSAEFSAQLILLIVGVVLALLSSIGTRRAAAV